MKHQNNMSHPSKVKGNEKWAPINGYDGMYEISSMGRVRSWKNNRYGRLESPRILKLWKNASGRYHSTTLSKDDIKKTYLVHRLVAEHFIGSLNDNSVVCHKNDIGSDNRVENLYIGTHQSNTDDKIRSGNLPRGDNHYQSKLNADSVAFIRDSRGVISQSKLAKMFDVHQVTISEVQLRKIWSHI